MKKMLTYAGLTTILLLNTAAFCSRDDDNTVQPSFQDTAPIVTTMTQGTWRVTYYSDHGSDETNHFTGYNFTFGSGNLLTATNGSNTYTGAWTITNSNSNDDSPNDSIDFNIVFSAPADFEDISDDWDIVSRTDTKIQLIDVGGSGDTDYITFERN